MKTIFDKTTRDELISRINSLHHTSTAQWGKMNVFQMTKHCTIWEEWILGTNKPVYKQEFFRTDLWQIGIKEFCERRYTNEEKYARW